VFVDIYERSWGELTGDQKAAAKVLGYSRSVWDRDGQVWSDSKQWKELSSSQQAAAAVIGYTQQEWDDTRRVYEKQWSQLNQASDARSATHSSER
jgi:hypothetical protein